MTSVEIKAKYDAHLNAMIKKYGNPALATSKEKDLADQLLTQYQQAQMKELGF